MTSVVAKDTTRARALIVDILLVLVLLVGAYFRLIGIDWGEYQYLHPDERFLVWVGSDISPVKCLDDSYTINACPAEEKEWMSWGEYFDTANSTMNPHNQGHGFYVYGTLPLFMARYVVEWVYGQSGFNQMTDVGRPLSAMADLLTVFLVFLIAARVYDRRVGILAAAFSAVAVLQIQQSHFFTVDTFLNFFTWLAIYFAVRVAGERWTNASPKSGEEYDDEAGQNGHIQTTSQVRTSSTLKRYLSGYIKHPYFRLSIAFGFALGCAVASKLNSLPVAVMLPSAFALTLMPLSTEDRKRRFVDAFAYLVLAAVVSIFVFRLFQPYAFNGPGFLGIKPNPLWVNNILEQRNQAAGDVDFPPALQWARRPIWFSAQNLVLWGLGLPLSLLAWGGFIWVGLRMLRGEWRNHVLLWGWAAFYFIWQSLQFNPTMRYQLPIYPALAIFAGWAVIKLWDRGSLAIPARFASDGGFGFRRLLAILIGGTVLIVTITWAYAFTRIYDRPITRLEASRWIFQNVPGPINLQIQTQDGIYNQPLPYPSGQTINTDQPYVTIFTAREGGILTNVNLPHLLDQSGDPYPKELILTINQADADGVNGSGSVVSNFDALEDPRGEGYQLVLEQPLSLVKDVNYQLRLVLNQGAGEIVLEGSAPAHESSWDDGIPYRLDGYDAYGGIYKAGLNFEMYWPDNQEKYERFLSVLDEADHVFITSSRQWGSLPRVPERYPLSTEYYRNLLGCPMESTIEWCYNVAQPGMFRGNLGFDLVAIFTSPPSIGPWSVNDQPSEEAFTVYDHPKVFIFRKSAEYDPRQVREILGAVNLSQVVHVTPKQADSFPANLLLPSYRWAEQVTGGTWSRLFARDTESNQILVTLVWYLSVAILGFVTYPIVRYALPGLSDRGFPLIRTVGLLLLSYIVWLAGSVRLPFTRLTIVLALLLLILLGLIMAYYQREGLRREFRRRWKYYLIIEGLFLGFFIFDLVIRYGNPDLWHPWKGGEKPMDFSYFNAVLKSTSFPPYDPWFAEGYLNYYYYGFVLVSSLVKFLGIVPSVAYNLILPTMFALIAMGAFSVGWNLISARSLGMDEPDLSAQVKRTDVGVYKFGIGLAAALGTAVIGNLGTVRMILQGYQRLAAPGGVIEGVGFLTRMVWTIRGAVQAFGGTPLPYGIGDWYWIPSRAIPAPGEVEPITEFPFFTVLYGDLHAHLFALPVALFVIAWVISVVIGRANFKSILGWIIGLSLGGLAIGALYPINLSDIYTYLPLGLVAIGYALGRYHKGATGRWLPDLSSSSKRVLTAFGVPLLLIALSFAMYMPYRWWYGQAYSSVEVWNGLRTPLSSYLIHWGLFLFVIVSWMAWETRQWLASTPLSALRKLEPYKLWIQLAGLLLVFSVFVFLFLEVWIVWLVLPLAVWSGVLILRPGLPDEKRIVLFLVGTSLIITLMVEVVVVRGDIGRMNTVFKFYLQGWTMLAISAAAALGWTLLALPAWYSRWRNVWQFVLILLVAGAALYPLLGGLAKIEDRMALDAPHTLDGMAYMPYAEYAETWGVMDLGEDYQAIRWMQDNIEGSPVIVEANLRNLYRWGSRFSIYTGLPGVVGWEWHQQQQRALLPGNWVSERIAEVDNFYTTTDVQQALDFLRKYNVSYIVLGQQERGHYAGEGLEKFTREDGNLWQAVYEGGQTVIYEVSDP